MGPNVLAENGPNILAQPVRVIVPTRCGELEETFVAVLQRKFVASDFVPHQIGADGPGNLGVLVHIAFGAQRSFIGRVDGARLDEWEGY